MDALGIAVVSAVVGVVIGGVTAMGINALRGGPRFNKLGDQLVELMGSVNAGFARMDPKFDGVNAPIDGIGEDIANIRERLAPLEQRTA